METFHVQRVGRRLGDRGAVYQDVVLTGTYRGQPVRVVLQLPWSDSPAYAMGDAVEVEWTKVAATPMPVPAQAAE